MGELTRLQAELDYVFNNEALLSSALVHRSACAERPGLVSNERLEFLGDSVLGLCVTDVLFNGSPGEPEGFLAKVRASVVNEATLAVIAITLDIGELLVLGRGEERSGGREKPSILADALEAVIGAMYLDGGYDAVRPVVQKLFAEAMRVETERGPGGRDYKTRLQELAVQRFVQSPSYIVSESGPEHGKVFRASVRVGSDELGAGVGSSKKRAEQAAAQAAYIALTGDDGNGAARG